MKRSRGFLGVKIFLETARAFLCVQNSGNNVQSGILRNITIAIVGQAGADLFVAGFLSL